MTRLPPLAFAFLLVLVITGCAGQARTNAGTNTTPRDLWLERSPANWSASGANAADVTQSWLKDFDSVQLQALVQDAVRENYDLQQAAARMQAASARARISQAGLLPVAQGEFLASRQKTRTSTVPSTATTSNRYDLEASIQWEADIWGRIRNGVQAADLDAESAAQEFHAARLSLAAEIARNWLSVIEARLQTQLALNTVENFRESLNIIEERYRRGLNSALDVHLARENLASAESNYATRSRDYDTALRQLETLLGRYPSASLLTDQDLPQLTAPVPAGLPAQLLNRRPDLLAAERRLNAGDARLAAARKNRLPAFNLTASGGTTSDALRDLLDWDQLVWRLMGDIVQPLFTAGRLTAEQTLAQAEQRELWAAYAQTILTAFREVETALASELRLQQQLTALERAAQEARDAADLALERYRGGLENITTLLEAQRRAFEAESNRLRTARLRLDNRVVLHLALGGDFEMNPSTQNTPIANHSEPDKKP